MNDQNQARKSTKKKVDNLAALRRKLFLEGPAGSGKTAKAISYLLRLLEAGAAPGRILILIPQVTLGRPYQLALHDAPIAGGAVDILTLAGVAHRAIETYWPIIAEPMGFAEPGKEPTFLNIETAQYFMARIAQPTIDDGKFGTVAAPRIISQTLDNLNRAAIIRFPLDEVADRLIAAWGERDSSQHGVYETTAAIAHQFRDYCLQHNLLDFSLQIEAFEKLRHDPRFADPFLQRYDFLIAENVEEDSPAAHDFIRWLMQSSSSLQGAFLVYDSDGGYRVFLGADPENADALRDLCPDQVKLTESRIMSPELTTLGASFNRIIGTVFEPPAAASDTGDGAVTTPDPLAAFTYAFHRYYPQMIGWVADQIIDLVKVQNVPPRKIVVMAPYLSDSLRFALSYRLNAAGIATVSHRPSRALRDEPVTRALLTLATLAHPAWSSAAQPFPPPSDIADTLSLVIEGIDPVRARLLTSIVYRTGSGELSSFEEINAEMRERITYVVGERYEALRGWLENYKVATQRDGVMPLDHFFSRLFGELLSQAGFGFHTNLESGRITAQLIASAQRFRRTLYGDKPAEADTWDKAGREYLSLVDQRLLAALFAQNWQDETTDAVFLAPAFTFLMRNRFVDYQFWLDAGSSSWSERLEQPLTHPYVLRRDYPADMVWTDEMESEKEREQLYKIVVGLTRRCRKQIYLGIADLGESGFEQRGMLLRVFQEVLRRQIPDAHNPDETKNGEAI